MFTNHIVDVCDILAFDVVFCYSVLNSSSKSKLLSAGLHRSLLICLHAALSIVHMCLSSVYICVCLACSVIVATCY